MRHRLALPFAVLAGAVLALSNASGARAAEPEVLADRWELTQINGKPTGYAHTVVRRTGTAEAPLVETTITTHSEMVRGRDKVITDEVAVTTERPDGALVSSKTRKTEAGKESVVEVTFTQGEALIATTELGQRREASAPVPAGTVGPWRAQQIPVEAGLKAGAKHEIPLYMNDFGGSVLAVATVAGQEEVETLAGKQELVRVDVRLGPLPTMNTWVTPDGATSVVRMEMMGMKIAILGSGM